MKVYVQRENGAVVGVYTHEQPGFAEEQLEDDHQDVIDYYNKNKEQPQNGDRN